MYKFNWKKEKNKKKLIYDVCALCARITIKIKCRHYQISAVDLIRKFRVLFLKLKRKKKILQLDYLSRRFVDKKIRSKQFMCCDVWHRRSHTGFAYDIINCTKRCAVFQFLFAVGTIVLPNLARDMNMKILVS